jgi:FkbM family methyltransferase
LLPHDKSYNALRHFIALKPNGLFLDVGANDGMSALSFRRFDKNYSILSLEPNRLLEPSLQAIKARDPRFDYLMVGAGSEPSQLAFHVPIYRGVALHTFTSMNAAHVRAALAASFGESIAAEASSEVVAGTIIRVDDLSLEPTIIKVDAEGYNYDVLVGSEATIHRSRPFVMIEVEPGEADRIRDYFTVLKYHLLAYDIRHDRFHRSADVVRAGPSGERNLFAIPNEMLLRLPRTDPIQGDP